MARCEVRPRRSSPPRSIPLAAALLVAALWAPFAAAQSPSGEYGAVPIGGSVEGVLAALVEQGVVYHTYTVAVPAAGPVTISVDGFGSDLDLALKFGGPILDYGDVDHLDTSEDGNPTFTFQAPAAGVLYVDVLNLLPAAASPASWQWAPSPSRSARPRPRPDPSRAAARRSPSPPT